MNDPNTLAVVMIGLFALLMLILEIIRITIIIRAVDSSWKYLLTGKRKYK